MKEFKDYATMLEEKKIKAKKKRDEVKRLRDEASYEERLLSYTRRDENEDIIANVREHFTAEQIANGEYFTLNGTQENQNTYESKEDWEQGNNLKGSESENQFWYFERELSIQANMIVEMRNEIRKLWSYIGIMENDR